VLHLRAVPHSHDVIIIGQGIAGTVLSEVLHTRGLRVCLFDSPLEGRATHAAAGLVNPVVLRTTTPSWRAQELLAVAGAFYREMEQRYDARFWNPVELLALFPSAKEAGIWRARMKDPDLARMISEGPVSDPAVADLPQPFGVGVVRRSAWVDVRRLLAAHRAHWLAEGRLVERLVASNDVVHMDDGVRIGDATAPLLVRCTGAFAAELPVVPVRGEGLTVRAEGLRLRSAVHRGVFMLPVGDDRYRVGATFAWDEPWSGPTEEGRRWLLDRVQRVVSRAMEVEEHWWGVRPTTRDRRPLLGRTAPHEAVLNGLGSRGVLLAPWCAQHLAAHLFDGVALDPEVDVSRF
jgi:glycine/D-amino acid oxidase-like deaminating enzyme